MKKMLALIYLLQVALSLKLSDIPPTSELSSVTSESILLSEKHLKKQANPISEKYSLSFKPNIHNLILNTTDSNSNNLSRYLEVDFSNCDDYPNNPCGMPYAVNKETNSNLFIKSTNSSDEFCIYTEATIEANTYWAFFFIDLSECTANVNYGQKCGKVIFKLGDVKKDEQEPNLCEPGTELFIEEDKSFPGKYFLSHKVESIKYYIGIGEPGINESYSNYIFATPLIDIYSLPPFRTDFYNFTIPNSCDRVYFFNGVNECWDLLDSDSNEINVDSVLLIETRKILYKDNTLHSTNFITTLITGHLNRIGVYPMLQNRFVNFFNQKPPSMDITLTAQEYYRAQLTVISNEDGLLTLNNKGKRISWGIAGDSSCTLEDLSKLRLSRTEIDGSYKLNTPCNGGNREHLYATTLFNGLKAKDLESIFPEINHFTILIKMKAA